MQPWCRHLFSRLAASVVVCFMAGATVSADTGVAERLGRIPRVLTSATGQFYVIGHEPGSPGGPPPLSNIRSNHVQLDPQVLAMTCEHVKSELLYLLQTNDQWKCTISVQVDGPAPPETPVGVSATRRPDKWRFTLRLPGQLERFRLVRAIVRALLLELANRDNPGPRLAEVPLWLQEGMSAQLYAMHGDALAAGVGARVYGLTEDAAVPKLVVNRRPQSYERNYTELLSLARRHFALFDPVDFSTLQLPSPANREGFAWLTFQHSAHLFVAELLKLPEGREGLLRTFRELQRFLNPQLAFLSAFADRFPTALAADKWWTLACVDFKSREANLRWSEAQTLLRLKEILHVPVEIRTATNAVPESRVMMTQELIRETAFQDHRPILMQSVRALFFVEMNSRRDLARLIRDYRDTIADYVRANESGAGSPARFKVMRDAALERLDLLDGIRFDFKLVASPEPDKPVDLERVERMLSPPVRPLTPP